MCVLPRSTASFIACRMVAMLNAGLNLESCIKRKQIQKHKLSELECRYYYYYYSGGILVHAKQPTH